MRWISTIAGLIATAAAVVVMTSLPRSTDGEATSVTPQVQAEAVVVTTEAPMVTEVVAIPEPDMSESGLDESVADALIASGYTEFVPDDDLGPGLDSNIVRVLTDAGAVLVIPEGGEG